MWPLRRRGRTDESTEALKDAKENLVVIRERGTEVTEISTALREMRVENHFVQKLHASILRNGRTA